MNPLLLALIHNAIGGQAGARPRRPRVNRAAAGGGILGNLSSTPFHYANGPSGGYNPNFVPQLAGYQYNSPVPPLLGQMGARPRMPRYGARPAY